MAEIIPFKSKNQRESLGTVLMPLKKDMPFIQVGYTLVRCPECGQECWKSPSAEEEAKRFKYDLLCTECGLRGENN